jgi:hypothetical protein
MIEIKMEANLNSLSCSYCGEIHNQLIDVSEKGESNSGFVFTRKLNPSGLDSDKHISQLRKRNNT